METIESVRIFVKVVQTGSFTKAGAILRIPKSTISKTVAKLESETGTKLLLRTTRSLTLTAAGKAFYDTCLQPIQVLEEARKSLHGRDSILSGTVRITAPEDLGTFIISPTIAELSKQNPNLNFELIYTDEIIDLVRDGFDLAVRIGRPRVSNLKSRKLGEVVLVLVASPEYLRLRSKIRDPRDLEKHDCLGITAQFVDWTLKSKTETVTVKVKPRLVSNQMSSLMSMAVSGAGIALVPHYLCREAIEAGKLQRVLPEYRSPGLTVSMLSPVASSSSARLRITTEKLGSAIQSLL